MLDKHTIDLIVVVVYLLGVTVIGCMMSRKTHSAKEFITAGGSLPGWVVGLSIIGTFVSSISFVANPGKTYSGNWNPFVFSLSLPYAALIATVFFVPFFRNSGSMSAYEHLEKRFGAWARLYAALFNILYHIGRIGTILFGVSLALAALLDIPIYAIIIGLGILVVIYTLLGGIEAVIWTDVVQSVVLIGGMVICLVLLLMRIGAGESDVETADAGKVAGVAACMDGFDEVISRSNTVEDNRLSLGSMDMSLATSTFWTTLIFGFFINLQNFAADQTYVQRYFTAKSEAAARRSVWMGALSYIPISAVLFFIGTALFVYYQHYATLPEELADSENKVLPYFIMTELPAGISGLLIAAILAAAMSTVDSSLNSSATLLLCDVRTKFRKTPASDSGDLTFLRLTTVALGIAGISAALAMMGIKSMLDVWWTISGILSGGTLGLILLARFTSVRGTAATLPAVIVGVLAIAVIAVAHDGGSIGFLEPVYRELSFVRENCSKLMAIVAGTGIVFVLANVLSLFTRNSSRQ